MVTWPSNRAAVFAGAVMGLLAEFGYDYTKSHPAGDHSIYALSVLVGFLLMILSTVDFSYLKEICSSGMSFSQLPYRCYEGFAYFIGPIRKRLLIYIVSFIFSYLFLSIIRDLAFR
jgi:hypothetical protein